ncbi:hypothetical protein FQA47_012248 [Oryzias melastigma]|uniref:Uncharacterized protein n=1 Tax=Oryzias melastigma TaxID=30732 RepID=A0A834BTH9_ORYME|nr:hypothetical protein FQA47_012248 [Oryzias melastigma]
MKRTPTYLYDVLNVLRKDLGHKTEADLVVVVRQDSPFHQAAFEMGMLTHPIDKHQQLATSGGHCL